MTWWDRLFEPETEVPDDGGTARAEEPAYARAELREALDAAIDYGNNPRLIARLVWLRDHLDAGTGDMAFYAAGHEDARATHPHPDGLVAPMPTVDPERYAAIVAEARDLARVEALGPFRAALSVLDQHKRSTGGAAQHAYHQASLLLRDAFADVVVERARASVLPPEAFIKIPRDHA